MNREQRNLVYVSFALPFENLLRNFSDSDPYLCGAHLTNRKLSDLDKNITVADYSIYHSVHLYYKAS